MLLLFCFGTGNHFFFKKLLKIDPMDLFFFFFSLCWKSSWASKKKSTSPIVEDMKHRGIIDVK